MFSKTKVFTPTKPALVRTTDVGWGTLSARFVSGRLLSGVEKTNARWSMTGRELRNGYEVAHWWARQSLRRRAGIRLMAVKWLVTHAWALAVYPAATIVALRVEGGIAAVMLAWVLGYRYRKYAHREGYIVPIGQVVAERLGYDRHVDPLDLVKVPLGHRTDPNRPVEVKLPLHWRDTPRAQAQFALDVASRAGIKSHDFEVLDGEGEAPRMLVRAQLVPPDEVMFSDEKVAELVRGNADDSKLFVGLGIHDRPVWIDWALDSPHLALSFGSGAGKSTLIRSLAAQTVYKGGRAAIFDGGKDGESHQDWTRDEALQLLNGVEFYPSIAAEHDALVAWEAERARRAEAVLARTGEQFQRVLLVLEERNLTQPKLQAHWASIRSREDGDPIKSPAIQAQQNLVAAGRSVNMNCVASAQRFDAAAAGGGSVRASFQVRMLSRFDDGARNMLIPEIKPKPKSSNHLGRAILCVGGEATDVQALYMATHEAVDLCRNPAVPQTSNRIIAPRPKSPALAASLGDSQFLGASQAPSAEPVPVPAPAPVGRPQGTLMKLSEAHQQGIVGGSMDALRKAAQTAKFPSKRGDGSNGAYLYDSMELAAWWGERQAGV